MNKSKFLKKSLAMVLAIMMVVAMIPLSASADDLLYFTVDTKQATVDTSARTITAEVANPAAVDLAADVASGWTVQYLNKDKGAVTGGSPVVAVNGIDNLDLTANAAKNGNTYTMYVRLSAASATDSLGSVIDYTINLTQKTSDESSDATLSGVKDVPNMVSYNVGAKKVTITMPFDSTFKASDVTAAMLVATAGDKATVSTPSTASGATTVLVAAEDGSSLLYTIEVVYQSGFTAFSVDKQTAVKIDNTAKTVVANVPYGYDTDAAGGVVVNFTHGTNIKQVTTSTTYNQNVVKSGDKVVFTPVSGHAEDGEKTLYLWVSDSVNVPVTVTLDAVDKNPEAVITDITVKYNNGSKDISSNVTPVTGETVSVEMPASTNFSAATAATVTVTASANATITVVGQATPTFSAGVASGVNISSESIVLKVVSQDGKTTNFYTVNFTKAAGADNKVTDVTLKGQFNGEDVSYTAVINDKTITLTVPYGVQDTTVLGTFKMYVTTSVGATVKAGTTDVTTGNVLDIGATDNDILPEFNNANGRAWTVTADDGSAQTYTVKLNTEAAKTARVLSAATMTSANNVDLIDADNTYTATVTEVKDTNGDEHNAIIVKVPYSFNLATPLYFSALTLSDGAKAYDKLTGYAEVKTLENGGGPLTLAAATATDGAYTLGDIDDAPVYVVSEMDNVNIPATITSYNTYYVFAEKAAAESGATLRSVTSTLDSNVKASLSGKTINITVPYSYDKTNHPQGTQKDFTIDFEASAQATLKFGTTPITGDKGTEAGKANATKFYVDGGALKFTTGNAAVGADATVTSEDTITNNTYTINLTVEAAKTEANLVSAKVNDTAATISGKAVTVVLPYGGNLNPVTVTLTASDMASITVGGAAYNADAQHDLNNAIAIKVTSEDGKTINTYTLTGTVASQFNDVAEDAWYYDYVMQAAAAGWVQGTGNGNFSPNLNVRRGDFSLMVVNMLGVDVSGYTNSAFKDVEADHYASAAIAYLADKGIVNGDANGNFNASSYIKRQEAAKIIAGALNLTAPSTYTAYTDDASIANWAKPYVYACQAAGVMTGDTAGTFRPSANIKRSEAAKVIVDGAKVK